MFRLRLKSSSGKAKGEKNEKTKKGRKKTALLASTEVAESAKQEVQEDLVEAVPHRHECSCSTGGTNTRKFDCRLSAESSAISSGSFERSEQACNLVERLFQARCGGDIEAAVSALAAAAAQAPDAIAAAFADDIEDTAAGCENAGVACLTASAVHCEDFTIPRGPELESDCLPNLRPVVHAAPAVTPPSPAATFEYGLNLAIGFQAAGLRHGWSVLVTAVPAQGRPAWTLPQFDWCTGGDASSDYLVRATFSSVATAAAATQESADAPSSSSDASTQQQQQQQQQQQKKQQSACRRKRFITLAKYPLRGQPIQLGSSSGSRRPPSSTTSAAPEVLLLTAQTEASVPCSGRLIGLYCTASYVTLALRQRDNIAIRVYNSDLWPISVERLMRNPGLVREAADSSDIACEKVQCLTVDKAEQTLLYYHSYRVPSAGNKQMRRICCLSLPDLQLNRRLPIKDDVKSIKVGSKYFALYFRDNRLAVYCKASRTPVFEFSAQKLGGLFQPGDTFEMDSQDRLVEVSEKRVRSLFYNGVIYRDCECVNLQELGRRLLIGRRAEFYEALQCHLATMRLGQQQQMQQQQLQQYVHYNGGCSKKACTMKARLRLNAKLLRSIEEYICTQNCQQKHDVTMSHSGGIPIVLCEDAFWFEATGIDRPVHLAATYGPIAVEPLQQQQKLQAAKQQKKH